MGVTRRLVEPHEHSHISLWAEGGMEEDVRLGHMATPPKSLAATRGSVGRLPWSCRAQPDE
jgi:hypothetical protein